MGMPNLYCLYFYDFDTNIYMTLVNWLMCEYARKL